MGGEDSSSMDTMDTKDKRCFASFMLFIHESN